MAHWYLENGDITHEWRPDPRAPFVFSGVVPRGYFTAASRRISPAIVRTRAVSFAPFTSPSTCFANAVSAAARGAPDFCSAASSAAEIADVRSAARPRRGSHVRDFGGARRGGTEVGRAACSGADRVGKAGGW